MPPSSGNQISAWELVAHISVEGDTEAKQKLDDFTSKVEQSQKQVNNAGGGGRGRGRSKMTRDDFLGTDDQWNSSEAREARGETGQGSKAVRNAAPRYLSAPPGGAPILMPGALLDAKNAAKWQGFSGPSLPSRMLPNAADQAQLDAAEQAKAHAAKLANSGNAPGVRPGMTTAGYANEKPTAGFENAMSSAPGVKVNMTKAGYANDLGDYADVVSKAPAIARTWLKNNEDIAKESAKARGTWSGYSIGLAYAARHVLAGGPGGVIGGGLGAAIGTFMNGPSGAYLGTIAGSAAGEFAQNIVGSGQQTIDKYGKFSPGSAYQRQRAELNAEAAEGSAYRESYKRRTKLENDWADFYRSGGSSIAGKMSETIGDIGTSVSGAWLRLMKVIQGVSSVPGSGAGSAPSPMGGKLFGSIDEAYRAMIPFGMMIDKSDTGFRNSNPTMMQATIPMKIGWMMDYLEGKGPVDSGVFLGATEADRAKARLAGIAISGRNASAGWGKGRGSWDAAPTHMGEMPMMRELGEGKGGSGPDESDTISNRSMEGFGKGAGDMGGMEPWQWLLYVGTLK